MKSCLLVSFVWKQQSTLKHVVFKSVLVLFAVNVHKVAIRNVLCVEKVNYKPILPLRKSLKNIRSPVLINVAKKLEGAVWKLMLNTVSL